jgi:predicted DNA-binding transcriptional regulator AlpA
VHPYFGNALDLGLYPTHKTTISIISWQQCVVVLGIGRMNVYGFMDA